MDGDEITVIVETPGEIFVSETGDEVRTYGLLAEADTIDVVNKGKIEASVSGLKDVWVYGMLLEGESGIIATNEGRIFATAVLSQDAWDGRKRVVGLAAHGTGPDTRIEVKNSNTIEVELDSEARAFISRLAGVEMEGSQLVFENTNTGDVKVVAEIYSDGLNPSASLAAGVLLDGSRSITVNNSGTIMFDFFNDRVFSTGEVAAMRVAGGHPVSGLTAQVEVTNDGEITNKARSFGTLDVHGVSMWGKDVTFVNKNGGKIAANHDFNLSGLIVSHGVQINRNARQPGNSTVENHGEIQVNLVTGEGYRATGMHIEASDLKMVNTGSIRVGAWAKPELPSTDLHWATGADLYIQNTARITNEGTIEVKAESDHGIPDAYGLRLNGTSTGSSVEIDNSDTGRIAAWVGSAQAIAIDATAFQGTVKLANHGTLVGDVLLGDGNSEVELHPGSAVEGHVFLGGGTNTARVWSGAVPGLTGTLHGGPGYNVLIVELDPSGGIGLGEVHDMTGKMDNFQEAHIKSGQWTLDETNLGNMHTFVGEHAGLVLNDTLVLGPNGLLGGHGTIAGSVDSGLGTVSPGLETVSSGPGTASVDGSIGTLTADTYTQSPGGTYRVETLADASSDRVDFTGVATLNGGTLQIVPLDPDGVDAYQGKTVDYTILTASSIVERPDGPLFDEVDAPVLLSASLHTERNGGSDHLKLTLTTRSIGDLARTGNEHIMAAVLDQIYGTDPDSELIGPFKTMRGESVARRGLNSLTGEIYAAYPVLSVAGIDRFAGAVLQGMADPAAANGRRGWVAAYGTTGKLKDNDDNAGADVKTVGGAAGMHVVTGPKGMVGVTAGFGHGTLDMGARSSTMTGDGYQLGVYGQYDVGMVRMTGLFVHARTRYDAQRGITGATGSVDRTAHGRFDGTQLLATLRGEVLRPRSGGTAVEPVFGLSWLRLSRNGFNEEGAGDANLQVDSYSASYLRGDVGLRINMQPTTTRGGWTLTPSLRAAYVHDFSAPSRDITVRLQGAPDEPRRVQGIKHATSGFRLGLGLNAMRDDARLGWGLDYEGEFRSDVQVHAVHAGVTFRF